MTKARASLSSYRAKPDLAIWAHRAGQKSGQALEALVEANKNQRPSHLFCRILALETLSCSLENILTLKYLVMFSRILNFLITTCSMARVDKDSA